jgi:DNA-binding XRE family transcriptional regulator
MKGSDLKKWRLRLRLTRAQLAAMFETSATTIYRWENDCPACPYPGMLRLALSAIERAMPNRRNTHERKKKRAE